uniref:Uncharacterized protein n=1 Tax=Mycena chlorophos TaxID=658473 RepID=A0ABQ0LB60_MYCCL|nr:predicted protein [Mycena chlorophos]
MLPTEIRRLLGPWVPAHTVNARHCAILRKALETYPPLHLNISVGHERLRVVMGRDQPHEFGRIRADSKQNGVLAKRATRIPDDEVQFQLRMYLIALDTCYAKRGDFVLKNAAGLPTLQQAEYDWHSWITGYLANEGRARPQWALEPLPHLTRVAPRPPSHESDDDEPELLAGTQTLKRAGFSRSPRPAKRLKDMVPDGVDVRAPSGSDTDGSSGSESESDATEAPLSVSAASAKQPQKKKKAPRSDGWIWFHRFVGGCPTGDETALDNYKRESLRVQWFRAEAEMYRRLEQYERKHAELLRVIARFRRDAEVWAKLANRAMERHGENDGSVAFARMQSTTFTRLAHNADVMFRDAKLGAHHDWVSASSIDELAVRVDKWRDSVFLWMDALDIHRAYKDF